MDDDVRRELDRLTQNDRDLRQAIADLDNHGSRGVLQLQSQVVELIKDVSEIKVSAEQHKIEHEQDHRDRVTGRRWLVGITVGAILSLGGILVTILAVLLQQQH